MYFCQICLFRVVKVADRARDASGAHLASSLQQLANQELPAWIKKYGKEIAENPDLKILLQNSIFKGNSIQGTQFLLAEAIELVQQNIARQRAGSPALQRKIEMLEQDAAIKREKQEKEEKDIEGAVGTGTTSLCRGEVAADGQHVLSLVTNTSPLGCAPPSFSPPAPASASSSFSSASSAAASPSKAVRFADEVGGGSSASATRESMVLPRVATAPIAIKHETGLRGFTHGKVHGQATTHSSNAIHIHREASLSREGRRAFATIGFYDGISSSHGDGGQTHQPSYHDIHVKKHHRASSAHHRQNEFVKAFYTQRDTAVKALTFNAYALFKRKPGKPFLAAAEATIASEAAAQAAMVAAGGPLQKETKVRSNWDLHVVRDHNFVTTKTSNYDSMKGELKRQAKVEKDGGIIMVEASSQMPSCSVYAGSASSDHDGNFFAFPTRGTYDSSKTIQHDKNNNLSAGAGGGTVVSKAEKKKQQDLLEKNVGKETAPDGQTRSRESSVETDEEEKLNSLLALDLGDDVDTDDEEEKLHEKLGMQVKKKPSVIVSPSNWGNVMQKILKMQKTCNVFTKIGQEDNVKDERDNHNSTKRLSLLLVPTSPSAMHSRPSIFAGRGGSNKASMFKVAMEREKESEEKALAAAIKAKAKKAPDVIAAEQLAAWQESHQAAVEQRSVLSSRQKLKESHPPPHVSKAVKTENGAASSPSSKTAAVAPPAKSSDLLDLHSHLSTDLSLYEELCKIERKLVHGTRKEQRKNDLARRKRMRQGNTGEEGEKFRDMKKADELQKNVEEKYLIPAKCRERF